MAWAPSSPTMSRIFCSTAANGTRCESTPTVTCSRTQPLMFTIAVAFLTTLVSGAIPAIQSSRADINEILKDETRGASSFRIGRISKALVIFEIALSCGLLAAAGRIAEVCSKIRPDQWAR